jgi:hypothetical protein
MRGRLKTGWASLVDRPVAFTAQPTCRPEVFYFRGGTSMDTKKNATSKKGKIRDLPESKKKLTSDQAKVVKGGVVGRSGGDPSTRVGFSFG